MGCHRACHVIVTAHVMDIYRADLSAAAASPDDLMLKGHFRDPSSTKKVIPRNVEAILIGLSDCEVVWCIVSNVLPYKLEPTHQDLIVTP